MDFVMLTPGNNSKITHGIVFMIPINVMNKLLRRELSSQFMLNHQSIYWFSIVSEVVFTLAIETHIISIAFFAAKVVFCPPNIRTLFQKSLSAQVARYFDLLGLEFDIAVIAAEKVFISGSMTTAIAELLSAVVTYLSFHISHPFLS